MSFYFQAMFAEIYGPTQLDLKHKLQTDYKSIAFAISGRSVGQFPGSILGGFLADRFTGYCHLMVAVVLDVAAGVTLAVPWSPNVTYMWIYCFLLGIVDSMINIGQYNIILHLLNQELDLNTIIQGIIYIKVRPVKEKGAAPCIKLRINMLNKMKLSPLLFV